MPRRLLLIVVLIGSLIIGRSFLIGKPQKAPRIQENSSPPYAVQQVGEATLLLDSFQGKTWMLRRQEEGKGGWLPISKIDSEKEASQLWRKTTLYPLRNVKEDDPTKSFSSLLMKRGYICVPLDKLRIGYYGIQVRINGKRVFLILDSGQPITHLDLVRTKHLQLKWNALENRAEKNVKSAGSTTDSLSTIEDLEIGDLKMGPMGVGGHDLSEVNKIVQAYADPLIDGELGSDVLAKYSAIVDFSVPELYLRPRKTGK